jgi:hypothetical protein
VWRRSVDQVGPWEVTGPRIGFHALRAEGGVLAYRALRVAHVPPALAAPLGGALSGAGPHVVGVATHQYPFDAADWAADLVIGGGSAYVARAIERKRGRARALLLYGAAWALAAGWASP